jgi:hypothetical protein
MSTITYQDVIDIKQEMDGLDAEKLNLEKELFKTFGANHERGDKLIINPHGLSDDDVRLCLTDRVAFSPYVLQTACIIIKGCESEPEPPRFDTTFRYLFKETDWNAQNSGS